MQAEKRIAKGFVFARTMPEFPPGWRKGAFGGRDPMRRVGHRALADAPLLEDRRAMWRQTAHRRGLRLPRCRTKERGSCFHAQRLKTPFHFCQMNAKSRASP